MLFFILMLNCDHRCLWTIGQLSFLSHNPGLLGFHNCNHLIEGTCTKMYYWSTEAQLVRFCEIQFQLPIAQVLYCLQQSIQWKWCLKIDSPSGCSVKNSSFLKNEKSSLKKMYPWLSALKGKIYSWSLALVLQTVSFWYMQAWYYWCWTVVWVYWSRSH